jgi:hypothetical protein
MKFNKYWFKPKKYGYGAFPKTWEGWTLVAVFAVFIIWRSTLAQYDSYRFAWEIILAAFVLAYVSKDKTEGKWKWRWG